MWNFLHKILKNITIYSCIGSQKTVLVYFHLTIDIVTNIHDTSIIKKKKNYVDIRKHTIILLRTLHQHYSMILTHEFLKILREHSSLFSESNLKFNEHSSLFFFFFSQTFSI